MNVELPAFEGLQRRKIKGEGGAENMHFCETNRIDYGAIFGVTPYIEGSYEGAAKKMDPVRLERNEAKRAGGYWSRTGMALPRLGRDVGDGDFTVWRYCWKVHQVNGILRNRRLT
jgi:hypothetical protein